MGNWIGKTFEVPVALETTDFRLRMLVVGNTGMLNKIS